MEKVLDEEAGADEEEGDEPDGDLEDGLEDFRGILEYGTELRGLSASYHLTWVILRSNEVILRSFISLGWILLQMSDSTRR